MPAKLFRLFFIIILSANPAYSQKVDFEHITVPDNLTSTNVTCILKDAYGFMWFGSFNGLFRYDGYNVRTFLMDEDPNSGEKSDVRCLFETKEKQLLIGTLHGLCVFDPHKETFTRHTHQQNKPGSISNNRVQAIYGDKKGNIWIGTWFGLDKFDPQSGTFVHFSPFKNHYNQAVTSITEDQQGNLLLYGGQDVCRFNPEKSTFEFLKVFDHSFYKDSPENLGVLLLDRESNLWLGNLTDGLCRYDLVSGEKHNYSLHNGKLKSNTILSLTLDSEGSVWVGTDGSGLYRYKNGRFENFIHDPDAPFSLSGNAVYALYEGDPGILWIGIYAGGVNVLKKEKQKFLKFTSRGEAGKKLNYKSILSMAPADDGKVWLGTDGGGLNLFDPKSFRFEYFTEDNSDVCANKIKSLLADKAGNLWCGTYLKGLCRIDFATRKKSSFRADQNNPGKSVYRDNIWSLCESRDGNIWIGLLSGGLDVYDPATGKFDHNPLNILQADRDRNTIFALQEDSKGRMWIGAETAGIICFDASRKSFVQFRFDPARKTSIRSNEIRDIFEDSKGNLWFGTLKGGLNKLISFSDKTFESYTMADGLPSNNVLSILEDDNQNLWITTDKGITCFRVNEKKIINFDKEDGVQSSKFIHGSKHKTQDGYMLFGGNGGLNMFHPDSIRFNNFPPPVVITHFKIFNQFVEPNKPLNEKIYLDQSIFLTKQIELAYQDFVFSIEFAALSFLSPQKNKYAYKLEGFDQDWTYVNSDKRFATYTNLNPGTYIFKVVASNNDGLWNQTGASLKIIILPPWWMAWWFKSLIAILILGAVIGLSYFRTKSIKQRNRFLQEEVKKQTRELKEVNDDLLEKNADISRKTVRILEQQDEILKQRDKLEQLNKTKDKLFSIIAHDLRNPVNSLTVLSKLLKKEFPQATDTGRDIIHNIEISSERIKSLLLNLLEWAKSQTGNIKVDPIKISVHKLIEENIQLHYSQASHKEIKIEAEIDASHYVFADYNMASTIVRNVLNNNIKYTPKGGKVFIRSEVQNGKDIILTFQDTGIGMTQDVIEQLFKANAGFSTQGTENEAGTGLGLIISGEFAELNFGHIEVSSESGHGSRFRITLPGGKDERGGLNGKKVLSTPEPFILIADADEKLIKEEFRGKKILVVDDDEQLRNSVKHILSDIFEVYEAMNVKTAFSVSEKVFPDLIISDIMMPGETGISFCQAIKSHKLTCHVPVILLTGQTSEGTHLEGLMAGADAFITKPFDRKIFLTTINNLLSSMEKVKIRFSTDPEVLPAGMAKSKLDEELLSRAIQFIEKNISDPDLNGDVLGKELGMSKSLLYTKIKNLTGQTVNEFIRIIRLKMSIRYLMEGKMTISQVSSEIGFNSASYFTRSFTQHFGLSPKDYIAQYKGKYKT